MRRRLDHLVSGASIVTPRNEASTGRVPVTSHVANRPIGGMASGDPPRAVIAEFAVAAEPSDVGHEGLIGGCECLIQGDDRSRIRRADRGDRNGCGNNNGLHGLLLSLTDGALNRSNLIWGDPVDFAGSLREYISPTSESLGASEHVSCGASFGLRAEEHLSHSSGKEPVFKILGSDGGSFGVAGSRTGGRPAAGGQLDPVAVRFEHLVTVWPDGLVGSRARDARAVFEALSESEQLAAIAAARAYAAHAQRKPGYAFASQTWLRQTDFAPLPSPGRRTAASSSATTRPDGKRGPHTTGASAGR